MSQDITIKLVRWVIFTAVVSVVPLGILFVALVYAHKPHDLSAILGNGELVIISWVLGIGGLGELIPEGSTKRLPALACVGVNVLVFICSLALFVIVRYAAQSAVDEHVSVDKSMEVFTAWSSLILFVASFFTSAGCVALSEV